MSLEARRAVSGLAAGCSALTPGRHHLVLPLHRFHPSSAKVRWQPHRACGSGRAVQCSSGSFPGRALKGKLVGLGSAGIDFLAQVLKYPQVQRKNIYIINIYYGSLMCKRA